MAESVSCIPSPLSSPLVSSPMMFSPACSSTCPERFITSTVLSLTFCVALPEATMPTKLITPIMAISRPKTSRPTTVASTYLKKSFIIFLLFCLLFLKTTNNLRAKIRKICETTIFFVEKVVVFFILSKIFVPLQKILRTNRIQSRKETENATRLSESESVSGQCAGAERRGFPSG